MGEVHQQVFWTLCLLQRKQPPGQTQRDVAAMMAAAGREQFGRPLNLRFATGMGQALTYKVTVQQLSELLGPKWLQLLDGGPEAARALRERPLQQSDPAAAAQLAGIILTDAWLEMDSSGEVTAYAHGCQLGDATFAFDQIRKMGAVEYAE